MKFTVTLAGVNIGITSIYDKVYEMCADYLTDNGVDFAVSITEFDIDFEREKSIKEAKLEHKPYISFPDDYLETLAVYRKIALGLLKYDVFLMHGVALGLNGEAYIFTAPSGVGKTTHTGFWLEKYPEAFIINGDKPLIKVTKQGVFAFGTPWAGKEGRNTNTMLPVKAVCLLFRGKENSIKPVKFSDVFPLIIAQSYRPGNAEDVKKTLELINSFGKSVRFYAVNCNLNPDAARVAYEGMNGDE